MTAVDREEILKLRARIRELEAENEALKKQLDLPCIHSRDDKKAEQLVAGLTGGKGGGHRAPYDVLLENGYRLEVKYSKLNPTRSNTKRWNWGRVLGLRDRTGHYDFLVLVGPKDWRYKDQYPDGGQWVYFCVPRSEVTKVSGPAGLIGSQIALNTNLATAKPQKSQALKRYLVSAHDIGSLALLPPRQPLESAS